MKSTLVTFASFATLANAVELEEHHHHLAEIQNNGTNAIEVSATNARIKENHLS
jgi:hypothetical protein